MRGVVLKESDLLKDALNGVLDKKPMSSLRVLAKYHFNNGSKREDIEVKLDKHMKQHYKGYKPSKWKELISQMVKSVEKYNTYKMIDVDEISITESEWDKIIELGNKQLEKLAFILLVYCKINNIKNPTCINRVNSKLTDILTECGIRMVDENKLLLNKLYNLGYISIGLSCNSTSIKINYLKEDDTVKISIDNFMNVISYYDEIRNDKKYIECECCKKRVPQSNTKPIKYCSKCAKKVLNIQKNEWKKQKGRKNLF